MMGRKVFCRRRILAGKLQKEFLIQLRQFAIRNCLGESIWERKAMNCRILVRAEIFREGDLYVGVCPDLDVSSFGETIAEARQSLREALEAFVHACEQMGTLTEVLEEAGFVQENQSWVPRQPVAAELVAVS
jgi:predicted RNase H-like HicB family nuclease